MRPSAVWLAGGSGGGERPELPTWPWLGQGTARASRGCSPRSITLHHRIRQASNPHAPDLKAFDARLQAGEVFSREDLDR